VDAVTMFPITLDAIAGGADIALLSRDEAVVLLLRLAAAQTRLAAAMVGKPEDSQAPDGLLTAPELAAVLHLNESWIRSRQRAGGLPHVRAGRYVRFRLSEVTAWLAQQ
jgi:excisionase family DNA binding protein